MPAGTGGLLTNGGSGATLTAIIAARHAAVGDDVSRLARLTLYASDQAHSAALRAAWIAGVPRNAGPRAGERRGLSQCARATFGVRSPPIARQVSIPLAVVVSAGTTNTGRRRSARRDRRRRAPRSTHGSTRTRRTADSRRSRSAARALLAGLGRCDSVALDPHKWLFVPFECGSLLVREPERLRAAFQVLPDYLRDVAAGQDGVNFADYGEQLTRQSRALKVWFGVRYFGLAAIRGEIDRAMDLAVVRRASSCGRSPARGTVAGAAGRALLPRASGGVDDERRSTRSTSA